MSGSNVYYLESIKRQLEQLQDNRIEEASWSLQDEVLADNMNWLDCYIDELKRDKDHSTPGPWRVVIDDTGGPESGWPSIWSDNADKSPVHQHGFHQEFWHDLSLLEAIANAELICKLVNSHRKETL
jgi:hypothetical protein